MSNRFGDKNNSKSNKSNSAASKGDKKTFSSGDRSKVSKKNKNRFAKSAKIAFSNPSGKISKGNFSSNNNHASKNENSYSSSLGSHFQQSRGGKAKKSVEIENLIRNARVVFGHHAILEVYKVRPKEVRALIIKKNFQTSSELQKIYDYHVKFSDGQVMEVDEAVLESQFGRTQGAVVVADELPELDLESIKNNEKSLILALDGVEDPNNLGAILRTAWLMGVNGVLLPQDRSVGLTPSVHKVASGGVEHVMVYYSNQFSQVFEQLKQYGFWVYGMSNDGKSNLFEQKFHDKVVFVLGGEDSGLRTSTQKSCDELLKIPQIDTDASYNVSVAAAIALTEGFRQIHFKKI